MKSKRTALAFHLRLVGSVDTVHLGFLFVQSLYLQQLGPVV